MIKSLLEKGLLKAGNFRRAQNKFKYVYLLTPKGFGERIRLTRAAARNRSRRNIS